MAKSTQIQFEYFHWHDPDTGVRVTRLTPPDVTCHRNYFYQKCFTEDGKGLMFGAQFGEFWNYWMLDLPSGKATQLTDQTGENTFGGFLSPDDRFLYFVRDGRNLIRLSLGTLAEEAVYRVPEGWTGYGTWVANSDCTKMVGIEILSSDWSPLNDWQQFRDMFFRKPRCRLIKIDLQSGKMDVIRDEKIWMGHPIYRPFDDKTIAFCHEGPHDLVDARMWFINDDGSNLRRGKTHEEGESCTHEFFVPDGSAMIYVSYRKDMPDRWIRSLDPVTLEDRALTKMPPCSHLMSNYDGTLLVGDGCETPADVEDKGGYSVKNDPFLYLFDLRAGVTRRIAAHNTSWKVYKNNRQVTHPHPSFVPGDKQVLYTSDCHGEPAMFLADLPA